MSKEYIKLGQSANLKRPHLPDIRGLRNVIQKRLRLRSDQRGIHDIELTIEIELLPIRWVVDRRRQRGEIAATLSRRGHS